jgi:hypothetical protein
MSGTSDGPYVEPVILVGGVSQDAAKLAQSLREVGLQHVIAVADDVLEPTLSAKRPRVVIIVEPSRDAASRAQDRVMRCLGDHPPSVIWSCRPTGEGLAGGPHPFDAVLDGQSRPGLLQRRVSQLSSRQPGLSTSTETVRGSQQPGGSKATNRMDRYGGSSWNRLVRLVYVSRSLIQASDADETRELRRILAVARAHNQAVGITGGLVRVDNCFIQFLEGPNDAVQSLMDRIRADSRHCLVLVRAVHPISSRAFADWSMACADIRVDAGVEAGRPAVFRPYQASPAQLLDLVQVAVGAEERLAGILDKALGSLKGRVCALL